MREREKGEIENFTSYSHQSTASAFSLFNAPVINQSVNYQLVNLLASARGKARGYTWSLHAGARG